MTNTARVGPFGLKTNGTYRKAVRIWGTALEELTQSLLLPVTEQRQQIKKCQLLLPVTDQRQHIKKCQGLWMAFQEHPCSSIPTPDSCFSLSCSGMWNVHTWGVRSWLRHNHISDQSRLTIASSCFGAHTQEGAKLSPGWDNYDQSSHPCALLEKSEAISRAETTIVGVQVLCTLGSRWLQLSGVTSTSPVLMQPVTEGHAVGKSEASTELQPQALRTWYIPNQGGDCQHNQEKSKSPRESFSSPSGSSPNPDGVV